MRFPNTKAILAIALLLSLLAVSCGKGAALVETSRPSPSAVPTVPAVDGVEFGATLQDWNSAIGAPSGGGDVEPLQLPASAANATASSADHRLLNWADMVPEGFSDEEVYERFEDRLKLVTPGTDEANALYDELQAAYSDGTQVNELLNGEMVELAGFVAPLSYDEDVISEFLLVPYFGACIHVPPPPPNQTVFVTLDTGMNIEDSWGPVSVTGTMRVEPATTDLAEASYTLISAQSRVYQP